MSELTNYGQEMDNIVPGLTTFVNKPVVLGSQPEKYPDYPFVTYTMISWSKVSEYFDHRMNGNRLMRWCFQNFDMTISFTAIGVDEFETFGIAELVQEYFTLEGVIPLRIKDIAIITVGDPLPRHTFIVNEEEKRYGFDVRFRIKRERSFEINTIDTATIKTE